MTYSKKIIDEVLQWQRWQFTSSDHVHKIVVWAKSRGEALSIIKTQYPSSILILDYVHCHCAVEDIEGFEPGSPWDLAACVLHHRQSRAGKTKSDRKSRSSSENLKGARDRKRVLGNNVSELESE